jgi:hypothetical protein
VLTCEGFERAHESLEAELVQNVLDADDPGALVYAHIEGLELIGGQNTSCNLRFDARLELSDFLRRGALAKYGRSGRRVFEKPELLSRINVIWGVQISRKKYSVSRLRPNQIIIRPSRLSEGRFAIVTDVRRDAVDVDVPLTNGTETDGEVVWS